MPDWLAQLQRLPNGRVFVVHHPSTPRYDRASAKRQFLISSGFYLGVRPAEARPDFAVEIAVWAPNPAGKGNGFYSCFRLFHRDSVVGLAQLFTFYDGTENSVGLKSFESALAYARHNGFHGDSHDAS